MDLVERRKIIGCGFIAAIVLSPFIALLYGAEFGLGIMTLGLGVTALLAFDGSRSLDGDQQRRFRLLALMNGLLALISAVSVGLLLT